MYRRSLIAALALGALIGAAPAWAHHSYAQFDQTKLMTVHGTVVKWEWTNPHTFLTLMSDAGTQWKFESVSPSMLSQVGFVRKSFLPGDKVTISFNPHRTEPNFGSMTAATLANGTTISLRSRRMPGAPGGSAPPPQ